MIDANTALTAVFASGITVADDLRVNTIGILPCFASSRNHIDEALSFYSGC
jgi:hypothetical protein